ncbi:MAG TPA: YciI family protein [Actinophytocola sp.]|uniref:YciI family protein n=1 Tax=Actinophytocola sp. TaxID=1872138 RepID=UPI002DDD17E1|nr:YciI family protein [Actinophytocola sp.]HEV2779803.1 YciI family protein [Actinophytocola sp.]
MDFELDTFHLEILTRGEKSAELDPDTVERLFTEHIDYRVKLRADGVMLAAGAVVGAVASRNVETGNPVVGLAFWRVPRERIEELIADDPGVRAGLYRAELVEYVCPKGALRFEEP